MKRRSIIVLTVLVLGFATMGLTLRYLPDGIKRLEGITRQSEPFPGLALGLSEDAALASLRKLDPGAAKGQLCQGNYGVGAYIDHLGASWQLMAHIKAAKVDEIRLFRSTRKGIRSADACRQHFSVVARHYQSRHASVDWQTTDRSSASSGLDFVIDGRLADGSHVRLQATRGTKKLSLCTVDVRYAGKAALVAAQ